MSNFRATTPLSRGELKSKGHGELSIHYCADQATNEIVSRKIVFCQSAQSLRSSRKHVWRIWIFSRLIRATWCGDGTINGPPVKSRQKFFWRMTTQHIRILYCILYCSDVKNESKVFHTLTKWVHSVWMQDEKCCWDWTVFHDWRHWRTILCSGLSWIHSSKRWWIITTERMNSGKHENWTRTGSYDQLPVW